jgi:hypothetical protein
VAAALGPQIVTNFHKLICGDMCRFVDDSTLRISASFAAKHLHIYTFLHLSTSTRLKSLNFSVHFHEPPLFNYAIISDM